MSDLNMKYQFITSQLIFLMNEVMVIHRLGSGLKIANNKVLLKVQTIYPNMKLSSYKLTINACCKFGITIMNLMY